MHNSSKKWWRYPMVWLVIAGPLAVVIASFITLYLALHTPEILISEDYYQRGLRINQTMSDSAAMANVPAGTARNHAATGGLSK